MLVNSEILLIILLVALGFYFKNLIGRILIEFNVKNEKVTKYLPWILVVIFILFIFLTRSTFGLAILLYSLASSLIMDAIGKIIKLVTKKDSAKKYIYILIIILMICSIIWPIYGFLEIDNVKVTNYTYETSKNIPNSTMKILVFSDLHMGTTLDLDEFTRYVKEMNDTKPDLILLVGDIFDESTTTDDMVAVSKLIGEMNSTYGIFYVFGNHDQLTYRVNPEFKKEDIKNNLEKNNITILEDEKILVNDSFYIVGRQDNAFTNKKRTPLSKLTQGIDKSKLVILLDHQPLDTLNASKYGVDLQFSGHTHGGQIWPIRQYSELVGMYDLIYGNQTIDDYEIITSSGIGAWGFPVRTGSSSEYVITNVNSVK